MYGKLTAYPPLGDTHSAQRHTFCPAQTSKHPTANPRRGGGLIPCSTVATLPGLTRQTAPAAPVAAGWSRGLANRPVSTLPSVICRNSTSQRPSTGLSAERPARDTRLAWIRSWAN